MKLKSYFLLLLYFGLTCCQGVRGANNNIKKGMYPYMAFIYFSDPSVVDVTGQRFLRSGALIRPDWLVTAAMGPSLIDPLNGFSKKTLLARTGAITIDSKFTLNEDEDEQEREIIQIVLPHNQTTTQWWTTDISLMKTLFPFNMTSEVGIKNLNFKEEAINTKTCIILVFAKMYGNVTEDKSLMMLFVELLPPSISNCGSHFAANTMTCAVDSDENKDTVYDPDFCQGNSGGPLICENEVIGLQTYIDNNCKQPHLYQLLHAWDNFITCGIENKCQEEHCGNICDVSYKDRPKIPPVRITPPVTHDTSRDIINLINIPSTSTPETTTVHSTVTFDSFSESEPSIETTVISTLPIVTLTTKADMLTSETTVTTTVTVPTKTSTVIDQTSSSWQKVEETKSSWPKTTLTTIRSTAAIKSTSMMQQKLSWLGEPTETSMAKEKIPLLTHGGNEIQMSERKAKVDLQPWLEEPKMMGVLNDDMPQDTDIKGQNLNSRRTSIHVNPKKKKKKKKKSASTRNMCVIQTMIFGFTVLLCL